MILCLAELKHYELYHKPCETVTDNSAIAVFLRALYSEERGCITETNYHYSIISPPILVAKSNRQKGGGGVSLSEYSTLNLSLELWDSSRNCGLMLYQQQT